MEKEAIAVSQEESDKADVPRVYAQIRGELYLFVPHFDLYDASAIASFLDIGNGKRWLHIRMEGRDRVYMKTQLEATLNPVFDFNTCSFVFAYSSSDGPPQSCLFRVKDRFTLEVPQELITREIREDKQNFQWTPTHGGEPDYGRSMLDDRTLGGALCSLGGKEEEEEEEEESDSIHLGDVDGECNSQLAVGYKQNRSFVVRGSSIGVFRHLSDHNIEFATNISKVQTINGQLMKPCKVLLHREDRHLILQDRAQPNKLHCMDLEHGKVINEWKIHDHDPVVAFAPESVQICIHVT
ncbi:uncharacterized protein FFNC_15665 [Fusarium fujikuroi]|nr:uncharacterized protein FFNC_15665 [Fusarium fujikuroi]